MWCQHCGQDVPALTASAGVPRVCARCQHPMAHASDVATKQPPRDAPQPSAEWQTDRRMKQIGRSLRTPLTVARTSPDDRALQWVDLPAAPPQPAPARSRGPARKAARAASAHYASAHYASDRRLQAVAWLSLVFGLGLAAGGVGLMGMGMFGEYPIFWQWGVGVTLAGQAVLIAGLVKVLMTLWGSSRAASRRLHDMQQELAEVGRTAEAIIAQRPGGASGFYGELARGASPALLIANLKGQIDHLATRLHHDV